MASERVVVSLDPGSPHARPPPQRRKVPRLLKDCDLEPNSPTRTSPEPGSSVFWDCRSPASSVGASGRLAPSMPVQEEGTSDLEKLAALLATWQRQQQELLQRSLDNSGARIEQALQKVESLVEDRVVPLLIRDNTGLTLGSTSGMGSGSFTYEAGPGIGEKVGTKPSELNSRASLKLQHLMGEWQPEPMLPQQAEETAAGLRVSGTGFAPKDSASRRESQKDTWQIVFEDKLEDYRRAPKLTLVQQKLVAALEWWVSLREPVRTGCLNRLVTSKFFEATSAIVIVMNSIYAAVATNNEVLKPFNNETQEVEGAFLAFYTVELTLRIANHRQYFLCNEDAKWNVFDLLLVLTTLYYDVIFSLTRSETDSINLSYLRALRILKLARILRVIRIVKVLSELRLMLNSVVGSVHTLFWGFAMLFLVFFFFALMFVQGATLHLVAHEEEKTMEEKILQAFGSVQVAMLTLFMATTGGIDWENLFNSVIKTMGIIYVTTFLFLIAFVQLALFNILTGIFVENALKLAEPDRETLALEQRKREMREGWELREIFRKMDIAKQGKIEPELLLANIKNGRVKAQLRVMGLDIKDAELFCKILVEEQAEEVEATGLDIDDFVIGCMHMRGHATSLDLLSLRLQLRNQDRRLRRFCEVLDGRLSGINSRLPRRSTNSHITTSHMGVVQELHAGEQEEKIRGHSFDSHSGERPLASQFMTL